MLEINKRSVGSVAKEADPILTLVPAGDELELELQIAAEDIGFVRKGDPVRVKLDAFPFQKHGTLSGKLTRDRRRFDRRRPDRQRPADARLLPGARRGAYRPLRAVPPTSALAPGMTVAAEIRVGERSVISYFLYPLMKAFDEGIREP